MLQCTATKNISNNPRYSYLGRSLGNYSKEAGGQKSKKKKKLKKSMMLGSRGFCPGVPVYKGITIVISLFRSHWLAIVYCLVLCSGSCEPVHEDRTVQSLRVREFNPKFLPSGYNNQTREWLVHKIVWQARGFPTHLPSPPPPNPIGGRGWDADKKNGMSHFKVICAQHSHLKFFSLKIQLANVIFFFPLTSKYGNARISVTTFLLR